MNLREISPGVLRLEVPSPLEEMPPSVAYIFLGEGVTFCIDPGYPLPQVERALKEALPRGGRVVVLLTHGHVDHYGAAGFLQREYGASVLVHRKDLQKVVRGVVRELEGRREEVQRHWRLMGFGEEAKDLWKELEPFRRMYAGVVEAHALPPEVSVGEWTLEVIPTPGHTAGSCCFYERRRGWLFSGDTLLPSGFETWLSGPAFGEEGAGVGDFLQGLSRIAALEPALILPGHGEPFKGCRDRIGEIIGRCKRHKEEVLKVLGLKGLTALEVAQRLDSEAKGFVRLLFTGQVFSVLEVLRAEGRVEATEDGALLWRGIDGTP